MLQISQNRVLRIDQQLKETFKNIYFRYNIIISTNHEQWIRRMTAHSSHLEQVDKLTFHGQQNYFVSCIKKKKSYEYTETSGKNDWGCAN